MADELRVNDRVSIPAGELNWRFSRSSGPGGQGVNTADSRAELSWDLDNSTVLPDHLKDRARKNLANRLVNGVITIAASEHRAQLRNREAAEERLAALLAEAIAPPPPPRRPTKPSRRAKERRITDKKRRGEVKRLRRPDED
ncbi:alternative ribosome rescue aminoacyl-tRNA hydrolase ArfB [Plantactinospora sp. GCM10030261]|uniref:alternative ribosome rescue aminoacyl-tRNA hydrolase ArfB n=1 Tax=Plantactinospora sp. GCM10030261 TaxID=3273420 RepID=UPI00361016A8